MTYTLTLTEVQAKVVIDALDLYSRIGSGQYEEILNPKFRTGTSPADPRPVEECRIAITMLKRYRNMHTPNESHSILSPAVSDVFRIAFDLLQVVRHAIWKASCQHVVAADQHQTGTEPLATVTVS